MQYRPHHTAISVRSLKGSISFYEMLGYVQVHQYDEEDGSMSIEAALNNLKAKGLADESTKITVGKTKVRYFFIQDPDGAWVEFIKDERYK